MRPFRYTLVADGTSDRCLLRVIDFVLGDVPAVAEAGIVRHFADPAEVRVIEGGLGARMRRAVDLYPCDVLFVHRDAEREPRNNRCSEIMRAAHAIPAQVLVPVVPVRMTESWLLIDLPAIRRAADNPAGRVPLALPRARDLEGIPDPKAVLYALLTDASEKSGRRRQQFTVPSHLARRRGRVADLIADYSPLRQLPAFRAFEADTRAAVKAWVDIS